MPTIPPASPSTSLDVGDDRLSASVAAVSAPLVAGLLPVVLGIVAGSTDMIGFLGLNGLFTAQVTGNLVTLAAHLVDGTPASISHLIAVPTFIAAAFLTRMLAIALESTRRALLPSLLVLQALLLCGFMALCVAAGRSPDPDAPLTVGAAMMGIAAMAVHNALGRLCLTKLPSVAVMTTNVTMLTLDLAERLLGRDPARRAQARERARPIGRAVAAFMIGCGLGAAGEGILGPSALALPTGLALLACALARPARLEHGI
jgi:uncharacterized membrane protein YoaK (UPF0700 family)